jgi:hypothetical protein
MTSINSLRTDNTDGLINWLRQPLQLRNRPPKSMRANLSQLIKICAIRTDPDAEIKSVGLPVDASASWRIMVFAHPLDNFIMT